MIISNAQIILLPIVLITQKKQCVFIHYVMRKQRKQKIRESIIQIFRRIHQIFYLFQNYQSYKMFKIMFTWNIPCHYFIIFIQIKLYVFLRIFKQMAKFFISLFFKYLIFNCFSFQQNHFILPFIRNYYYARSSL